MQMKIKDLAEIQIGYQHRDQILEDYDQSYRIIQIKDITEDRRLDCRNLYTVTPKGSPDRYLVENGDVLFLSRGQRLLATPILSDLCDTLAAYVFFIVRPRQEQVLTEYLAWFINQRPAQDFFVKSAVGTIHRLVNKTDFEELEVDLPPLETQAVIVQLENLRKQEEATMKKITDLRRKLVHGICLQAARQTNNKKGAVNP